MKKAEKLGQFRTTQSYMPWEVKNEDFRTFLSYLWVLSFADSKNEFSMFQSNKV